VVFLGPPGVGKGTQAVRCAEALGVPQISTGDMFRAARNQDSDLGRQVKDIMDRGDLVPDDVVIAVVADRLQQADAATGFILDGFPRTVPQADALSSILSDQNRSLEAVVSLAAPPETILERLGGRRTCAKCNASFHVTGNPPKAEGVCDACGGELIIRKDDEESAIKTRLATYEANTAPLIEYYRSAGLLREVQGGGDVEEVASHVANALS
ncbi:MAG: adenylate kinase, partial [Planctomycetota bacterium]